MTSETGEEMREMRQEQRERREKRLPVRVELLLALRGEGFEIKELSPYQFRVNGVLDVYPIHHRFHDIKKNVRGGFSYIPTFVRRFFNHHD